MKKILNKIFLAGVFCSLLAGCKRDIENTVMQKPGQLPTVTLTPSTVVLTAASAADTVETISWTPSQYGFSAAVTYTVQIAKAGTNFVNPKEINMGSNTRLKYSGADLNQLALLRGLTPGSAGQLDIRVKSSLSDSVSGYSNKVTLTVTPYLVVINYPSLWVPGDYQGWDPASAPKISSKLGNGVYEGYVNITASTLQFKYTSDPDWNHTTYGWASSTTSGNNVTGTFNTTGGNLFVPTAGYYLLTGNTVANTWSATKINSWSLIGDFNSWGGDADMVYNATTKVWTATVTIPANGVFKFRANHDWPINFGDDNADLNLDYNGANIAITAGTHVVTLDLHVPGNYTYTIL
jgi:hypothetical protein